LLQSKTQRRANSLAEDKRAVLAGEHADDGASAFGFQLASEIVEVVVLTSDTAFLQTLREALGGSRRLWHVAAADKLGDLLVAGKVGILVLDAQQLQNRVPTDIARIRHQFPDLVIVLAGDRDVENAVAMLISDGTIYRFIHKPMSPGRAKLFVEAAVRRHAEQRRQRAFAPARNTSTPMPRGLFVIGACGVVAISIGAAMALRTPPDLDKSVSAAYQSAAAPAPGSPLLMQAAAALAANRLTEPSGNNALELYLRELAMNPGSAAARNGLAETRERLYSRAQIALLEERLDVAGAAIDTARKAGVESGRIALLTARLAKSRDEIKARRRAVPANPEVQPPADGVPAALAAPDAGPSQGASTAPTAGSMPVKAEPAPLVQPAPQLEPTAQPEPLAPPST